MSSFQPFKIIHVDTASQMPVGETIRLVQQNKYVVLWWNNIPLGHLLLPYDYHNSSVQLLEKLYEVISTTLAYYIDQENITTLSRVKDTWMNQDKKEWNTTLEKITASYAVNNHLKKEVSVVICTHGRPEKLKLCLEKLQQQVYPAKEIIVIDNDSVDTAAKEVVMQFKNVTYCLETRPGLDLARNTGAKIATGNIIAFTDDDATPHPLWLYYIEQAFTAKDVMGVTGLIFTAELETEAQLMFEQYWSFNKGYIFKTYTPEFFNHNLLKGVPAWEIGSGANMAFRKEIFEQIGYFDERLDVGAAGCNGDSEFWYRLMAAGYTINYTPLAIAYHTHRREMKEFKKQIFYSMRGFAAALHIQYHHHGHQGNLTHLYKFLLPYYMKIFPKVLRYRFRYNSVTYIQELKGIFSGVAYYYRNRKSLDSTKNKHADE